MFHLPGCSKLLAVLVLACGLPVGAAHADHYRVVVLFTDGYLSGSFHLGYFTTNKPVGEFFPDAHAGGQLMSLTITIDGAKFVMQDDKEFTYMPRAKIPNPGDTSILDYDASNGSATALHDKWMWMYRSIPDKVNLVAFGTWRGSEEIVESTGVIYDIVKVDPKRAPPEPDCAAACHSTPRR